MADFFSKISATRYSATVVLEADAHADPYSDRVVFKFELDDAVPSVRVTLYSRMGVNVANFAFGEMQAGRNSLTITPDIAEGYYVAYVWPGNHKFQAIIVK